MAQRGQQDLLYKIFCSKIFGHLSPDLARYKSGPIVHSRWLTTADTLLKMWMSHHGLEEMVTSRDGQEENLLD